MTFRQSGGEPVFPQGLQLDRRAITIGAEQRQINLATAERFQSLGGVHLAHTNRGLWACGLHGAHDGGQVVKQRRGDAGDGNRRVVAQTQFTRQAFKVCRIAGDTPREWQQRFPLARWARALAAAFQ